MVIPFTRFPGHTLEAHCITCIVKRHGGKLDPSFIETFKTAMANRLPRIMRPDISYNGINDNFPSMDMFCCLIGGEMVKHEGGYQKGLLLMKQLKSMLIRRGFISEYTSPVYSPITLQCLFDIYEFATDENVRRDALLCSERMLFDLLGHYHPETCHLAGPYSRAYNIGNVAHTNLIRYVYHTIFGDRMPINLFNTLLSSEKGEEKEVFHISVTNMMAECAYISTTTYLCPQYMVDLAFNKQYPFTIEGTSECRSRFLKTTDGLNHCYPGGSTFTHTYMTGNYAFGVASREFSNGSQNNTFQLNYRRRPVQKQGDMATVFCKYVLDDICFDGNNQLDGVVHYIRFIFDEGRKLGIADKNTGVMIYNPKPCGDRKVKSMRLCLFFPAQYGLVEKMWLGGKPVDLQSVQNGMEVESAEPVNIIVKDGPVYTGFSPLALTDHGRKCAVKVGMQDDYLVVSLYNYEGEAREFDHETAVNTCSGFAVEVRDENEVSSFEEFKSIVEAIKVDDAQLYLNGHITERDVTVTCRDGLEFACGYTPFTESVKYSTVNGNIRPSPVLYASGFDIPRLPFYNEGWNLPRGL